MKVLLFMHEWSRKKRHKIESKKKKNAVEWSILRHTKSRKYNKKINTVCNQLKKVVKMVGVFQGQRSSSFFTVRDEVNVYNNSWVESLTLSSI